MWPILDRNGRISSLPGLSKLSRFSQAILISILLLILSGCGASSDTGSNYPERDIRFLVGTSPGGGFDAFARTLAPYLQEYLPNDTNVMVENLTGAGGVRAANTLYTAPPDGYTIGITNTIGLAASQVSGQSEFDITEFTWIGRLVAEPQILYVGADSEFQSVENLQSADRPLRAAITGLGSSSGISPILICNELGIEWEPVNHEGSTEANLSIVRGDTDFRIDAYSAAMPEIEAGETRPILGVTSEPEIPGFPELQTITELGYPELGTVLVFTRDIAAPPDLPEDVRNALAQAFEDAVNDPDFQAEIEKDELTAGLPWNPLNAEETTEKVAEIAETYAQHEDVIKEAFEEEQR